MVPFLSPVTISLIKDLGKAAQDCRRFEASDRLASIPERLIFKGLRTNRGLHVVHSQKSKLVPDKGPHP